MTVATRRVAILWTGGKDCSLALHRARLRGDQVVALVTFTPEQPHFHAHSLELMALQARALDLPHELCTVTAPFAEGYRAAFATLRALCGVDTVVTGDIAEVGGQPNFVDDLAVQAGLQVWKPLWQAPRRALLLEGLAAGFHTVITAARRPWLDRSWVGRVLDHAAVAELEERHVQNGLDLCGENGEYHTMVVAGPGFDGRITWDGVDTEDVGELTCLRIRGARWTRTADTR